MGCRRGLKAVEDGWGRDLNGQLVHQFVRNVKV
jgi:hypothetical protein